MKKWLFAIGVLACSLVLAVSCRQLYTTSIASNLSRGSLSVSSDASIGDLLSLANSSTASDAGGAKAILDALSGKSQQDLKSLPVADQTAILNLATTATVDMTALTTLAQDAAKPGSNTNDLISKAFTTFDSTVNLTAIETVLSNTETVKTAPVESIVLASSVVLADVAADIGASTIMNIMATKNPDLSSFTPAQQSKITLVTSVVTTLNTRPASEVGAVKIAGFDLKSLLEGNKK